MPALLRGIAVSASASGLALVENCPSMYSAPPATKIAETTVVIRKARTLLRDLRPLRGFPALPRVLWSPLRGLSPPRGRTSPPRGLTSPLTGGRWLPTRLGPRELAVRLRCCDNAVLPSATRDRQVAGHAGPLRPRQRVVQNRLATHSGLAITELPDRCGRTTEIRSQPPLAHHVARSDGTDQAFP